MRFNCEKNLFFRKDLIIHPFSTVFMSRAPPRRIQPVTEFASSSRCVSTNACATALLISGTVGTRGIDFEAFHRHVVLPLVALRHEVDTYACLGTTDAPLPDWWGRLRHLFEDYGPSVSASNETATKHASLAMYARLTSCWHHAMRSTEKDYSLFVYARPDILWWGPLRMPSNLNAVFVRARAIRLLADEQIHQQQMSIPCHSRLVAFVNSVQVASDAESKGMVLDCFFIDDQIALVPARFARAYFDSGAEWHSKESCVPSNLSARSCPLSMNSM